MEIAVVIGLLLIAVVLFATETVPVDITTLLLLMALVTSGILTPDEAFRGFSSDFMVILASIFILSGAMQRAGFVDAIGLKLVKIAGRSVNRLVLVMMLTVGSISAFINNTTATAIFVAPIVGVTRRMRISPSKVLIPLAYASILGGTITLIGTSTNVAVSGYISKLGMQPLSMFEITPIGLVIMAVGVAYMVLVGTRQLPYHPFEDPKDEFAVREYLSEIVIVPDSHMIGQRIAESDLAKLDFRILEIVRGDLRILPKPNTVIESGDILLVNGRMEELIKVKATAGIEILADLKLNDPKTHPENSGIGEVLINPRSELNGRTLKESSFRERHGMTVLAIYREGHALQDQISNIKLRFGDLLLLQGPKEFFTHQKANRDFTVFDELNPKMKNRGKGMMLAGVFLMAILVSALGWLPISIAFLGAALFAVLSRSITMEEAYEMIDWRLLILIGGMTAFGLAMEKTGTAEFLAEWIVRLFKPFGVYGILAGFFVLTIALTQPMSNAAAALVVLPVALSAARELGVNERTFAIAIMLAASISFIAPFEPSCVLVYGPGKYKLKDFVKAGLGLTIVLTIVVLLLIPVFWPLEAAVPGVKP